MAPNTLLGDVVRRNSGFSGSQVQNVIFPSGLPAWAYQGFLIKIESIDRNAIEAKGSQEFTDLKTHFLLGNIQNEQTGGLKKVHKILTSTALVIRISCAFKCHLL